MKKKKTCAAHLGRVIQTSKVGAPQATHMEAKGSYGLLSSLFDRARTNCLFSIISFLIWLSRSCICCEATYEFFLHQNMGSEMLHCSRNWYLIIKTSLGNARNKKWHECRTASCDIAAHCNNSMRKIFSLKRWSSTRKRNNMELQL